MEEFVSPKGMCSIIPLSPHFFSKVVTCNVILVQPSATQRHPRFSGTPVGAMFSHGVQSGKRTQNQVDDDFGLIVEQFLGSIWK